MNALRKGSSLLLVVLATACEPHDSAGVEGIDGFGEPSARVDAGRAGQADGGMSGALDAEPLAFGVVASDYTATSITLLAPDAAVLARDFIHSGSASAGLVTALSGDVVLPTRSGTPRTLTVLDRFRTDVMTWVDPASGRVVGQLKTHRAEPGVALSSNPQDYVQLGPHDAWVTRFEPNPAVPEDDPDRGQDLLHVDPTELTRGERIPLSQLDGVAERAPAGEGGTSERVTVFARPSTMVRLGEHLVVGIASLSMSFDAAGEGKVALVDPAARSAEGVTLPGLSNCPTVVPVPDDDERVVVACSGFFRGEPREGAGLAVLHFDAGELEVEHLWRAADAPDAPLAVANIVAVGGTEVVAVAEGRVEQVDEGGAVREGRDVVFVVDVATGEQRRLFEAEGRYVVGSGAFNARRRLLFVPDGSTDGQARPNAGVRVYHRDDDGHFEARDVLAIDDVLPVRQVRPL